MALAHEGHIELVEFDKLILCEGAMERSIDPFEQVIYQIMSIENYIEQVLDERQIKNVIEIWYENMCSDWHRVLKNIAELCANYGVGLQENQPPSNIRLRPSEKQILDDREWGRLCHLVNAIYNQS